MYPVIGLFVLLTVAALTFRRWFGKLEPIHLLRSNLHKIDAKLLELPPTGTETLTIEYVRTYKRNGERIVVAHFLERLTLEFESRIRNGIVKGALMPLLVVAFIYSSEQTQLFREKRQQATATAAALVAMASPQLQGNSPAAGNGPSFPNRTVGSSQTAILQQPVANDFLDLEFITRLGVFVGSSIGLLLFFMESMLLYTQLVDLIDRHRRVLVDASLTPAVSSADSKI